MKFELSFTNKEITPWGGMVFLKQMLDKIEFKNQVYNCNSLPTQNSNRGYDISVILESFITSIWCGANRFLHTEVTRADKALGSRSCANLQHVDKQLVNVDNYRKTTGQKCRFLAIL